MDKYFNGPPFQEEEPLMVEVTTLHFLVQGLLSEWECICLGPDTLPSQHKMGLLYSFTAARKVNSKFLTEA